MTSPSFSEFSYGYAITDNLIHGALPELKGAPLFPSLREEGKPDFGYDVKIPTCPVPVFLQFKIPQIMQRRRQLCPPDVRPPYYRMHLRTGKSPNQHERLLIHARKGRWVYYVTPQFEEADDLNSLYLLKEVPRSSLFIPPDYIGPLDARPHHVGYERERNRWWLCSAPLIKDQDISSGAFFSRLRQEAERDKPVGDGQAFARQLSLEILETTAESLGDDFQEQFMSSNSLARSAVRNGLGQFSEISTAIGFLGLAGYLARLYLDCDLTLFGRE